MTKPQLFDLCANQLVVDVADVETSWPLMPYIPPPLLISRIPARTLLNAGALVIFPLHVPELSVVKAVTGIQTHRWEFLHRR